MPYRVNYLMAGTEGGDGRGGPGRGGRGTALRDMAAVAAMGDAMRMDDLRRRVLALKAAGQGGAMRPAHFAAARPVHPALAARALPVRPAGLTAARPVHGAMVHPALAGQAHARAHAGILHTGRRKLRVLGHFANHAIKTGDNRALRRLLTLAKSDPHVSRLIPADFDVEATGAHAFRVTSTLTPGGLAALAGNASRPLAAEIAKSPPGRYTYRVEQGKVTDFEAAPDGRKGAGAWSETEADIIPRSGDRGGRRVW